MRAVYGLSMDVKKVHWILLDASHPNFDLYVCAESGCKECFMKGENPNIVKPYGENHPSPASVAKLRSQGRLAEEAVPEKHTSEEHTPEEWKEIYEKEYAMYE